MGANMFRLPQTQHDSVRMSVQVKGSPFDSVRRWQTPKPPGTSLTRKRSLVQVQYGPPRRPAAGQVGCKAFDQMAGELKA